MSLLSRISHIEVKTKSIQGELDRRKKQEQMLKQVFESINLIMEELYPEHEWCSIPLKERHRIYYKPKPRGTYRTEGNIKIYVPSKDKEDLLLEEVFDITCNYLTPKNPA